MIPLPPPRRPAHIRPSEAHAMPKPPSPTPPDLPEEPAPGTHLDLVCLQYARKNIRGRIPPDGPTVVVRTGDRRVRPVPAEIFTVEVERSWVFGHTRYVKGTVTESRLDIPRLALRLLGLRDDGPWDPEEDAWLFELEPTPLSDEIRAAGPRTRDEMEQVVPEDAVAPSSAASTDSASLTGATATSRRPSRSSADSSGSIPATYFPHISGRISGQFLLAEVTTVRWKCDRSACKVLRQKHLGAEQWVSWI